MNERNEEKVREPTRTRNAHFRERKKGGKAKKKIKYGKPRARDANGARATHVMKV